MRIIFTADVHHAFKRLEELLELTRADLYLITGDLVSRAFFRYETSWRFMELEQILKGERLRQNRKDSLYALASDLLKDNETSVLAPQADEYVSLSRQAETHLQKTYARLERIFANQSNKRIFVLPGNYDMDLRQTALAARDLHLTSINVNGWCLAGYGGAGVDTPGMPDHLQVSYEVGRIPNQRSEAYDFFKNKNPDIVVLHQPVYGYLDNLPGQGHSGNPSIRDYVETSSVKLVLSGHIHEQWGALVGGGTLFLNPSNFGTTIEVARVRQGGFFFDIRIKDEGIDQATLCQLQNGKIHEVVDYRLAEQEAENIVLDEKRYTQLGGKAPKTRHIEPIRHFQRVKSFFLGYETPETKKLIKELEGIQASIKEQGMEVAFDLLGSLSFGMAQDDSDMDLVVYMRAQDCVLDEEDTCGVPRPLAAVMRELEERNLEIEVCDSMDLDRIKQAIEDEDEEDGQLQRFIFYRLVCRPINIRLIKSVENLLMEHEEFRQRIEEGLQEHLDILVSSVRHIKSFDKYKTRLREQGVEISEDVEEALRNYLRGSKL
jgi:Icc-related predicted phosphoesterase